MDKKILISITGTTCAGKSTLLKAIKEAYDDVFIIPQVTTRQPRSDDDPDLIKYSDTLDKNNMFLYNKELSYGIEQVEIDNFLLSDKSYAVAINGSDEIEMLKSKSHNLLSYKNVLLTFTRDYNSEIESLSKQLKSTFDEENYQKRMMFYSRHIKDKLLNTDFIGENIDLHLTRMMSTSSWSFEIANILQTNPHKLYLSLCKEIKAQPKIKKYVDPEVSMGISRIISSLQYSRK